MKGNPISTFQPCSSFHIGEVIHTWLARLMRWDLGSSPKQFAFLCKFLFSKISAKKVLKMSINQNRSFLRQNISKSIWWVSSLLDLWYIYRNPGQILNACGCLLFKETWSLSVGKTSSKYFNSLLREIKSWCILQSLVPARATAPQW